MCLVNTVYILGIGSQKSFEFILESKYPFGRNESPMPLGPFLMSLPKVKEQKMDIIAITSG